MYQGAQYALEGYGYRVSTVNNMVLYYIFHMQCSREVALASYFTQMIQPPTKLGVIGSGCSVSTEATAEIAGYFNLTQVMMSCQIYSISLFL